jgi:NRAMP (natural resistance-associated macrophage protein)-like metal ion transporter
MSRLGSFWRKIGPGLVTGASDDDPSGIAIYSQVGAQTGFSLLWTSLLTFPLMVAIQEMCARIGLVTGHGLAGNLKRNYSKPILVVLVVLVVAGNTLNIGADLAAMAASTRLLIPIPEPVLAVFYTALILLALIYSSYQTIAKYLKWTALTLLAYLLVPFFTETDWMSALKSTVLPSLELNKETLALIVAIFGTTISPYLFFWQTSMEVEDKMSKIKRLFARWFTRKQELKDMRQDVTLGMLLSNIVMWFIIVTGAVALNQNGLTNISTTKEAAEALRPVAGDLAYVIFTLGVVSVGFLAIPVLAGASSYALSEIFGWQEGLDKKTNQAPQFYMVIIISTLVGLLIPLLGFDPIKALVYTGIFYGFTAPIFIYVILHVTNNKKIMGRYTNSRASNILGYATFAIMTLAFIALVLL